MLKLPIVDGSTPDKEFEYSNNDVSTDSFPIDGEIDPTTPLDDISILSTATPLHAIPVQLHTVVVGTPTEQLHPLTPLIPWRFVAAATSHIA